MQILTFSLGIVSLFLALFFFHCARISKIWHEEYGGRADMLNAAINHASSPERYADHLTAPPFIIVP